MGKGTLKVSPFNPLYLVKCDNKLINVERIRRQVVVLPFELSVL